MPLPRCLTRARLIWWSKLIIPLIIAFPFCFRVIVLDESRPYASPALGITLLTALYWVLEPVSIVITSFMPICLMPLFHVTTAKNVANEMWTDTSVVFLGGFIFSIVMVKWNLHSRLALKTVLIFGLRPWLLLLGMMLVTTFLSMWISNTACALTMVPNAVAIIAKLEEITGDPAQIKPFATALLLAIPFSCSVGGFITLIGTPPNLILAQIAKDRFPDAPEIGFAQFMFLSLPTSLSILALMYFYFLVVFLRQGSIPPGIDETIFRDNYLALGKMKLAEKVVVVFFAALAMLWLFRGNLSFSDSATLIGWSNRLFEKGSSYISDGTVALAMSVLLFIVHVPQPTAREEMVMATSEVGLDIIADGGRPTVRNPPVLNGNEYSEDSELQEEQTEQDAELHDLDAAAEERRNGVEWVPLLDWPYAQERIPWQILFLFSGGFVLNRGFSDSGLDLWLGDAMKSWTEWPLFGLLMVLMLVTTAISVICSNTACANLLLPLMAVIGQQSKRVHPWLLMFPTCFMTSCCFLLPISTPPNLIAYGYQRLTMRDFIVHGSVFTVMSLFVVVGMCLALLPPVFDARGFPEWANPPDSM